MREEPAAAPPQLGKVVVRAALIAVLIGVGYLAYVRLRDAAPSEAATLSADPAPTTVDPDAPRLDQIVLTLADLPRGWSASAVDASSDDICDGRVPRSVIKPTDLKSANFALGDSGSVIGNVVQEFSNEEQAKSFMDLTADVVDACRSYGTGEATISLQPFDFPKFGEETFVAQVTGTAPGGESHGAIVYLRVDNRVASVVTITFGESTVNKELIEHLTQLVAHRMTTAPELGDLPAG